MTVTYAELDRRAKEMVANPEEYRRESRRQAEKMAKAERETRIRRAMLTRTSK